MAKTKKKTEPRLPTLALIGGAAVAVVSVVAWALGRATGRDAASNAEPAIDAERSAHRGPDMTAPMTAAEREAMRPATLGAPPRDPELVEEV